MTRAGHTDCCSRSQTPMSLHPATGLVPALTFFFFFPEILHTVQHAFRIRFSEKGGLARGSRVQPWLEKQGITSHRAGLRHHLFDKACAIPQRRTRLCQVPGQSSLFTWSREAPGFSAGAILIGKGQIGTRKHGPCRELHVSPRCHRAPLSLNPARKRDALFPQG